MRKLVHIPLLVFSLAALGACSGGNSAGETAGMPGSPSTLEDAFARAHKNDFHGRVAPREAHAVAATQDNAHAQADDLRAPRSTARRARLELPPRASGAVYLEDASSGLAISFTLEGARDAEILAKDGIAVYAAALVGGDLVHRPYFEGTEDFALFAHRPLHEDLNYRVDLRGVAGLRLVANSLEFLDQHGAPRIRVAPPFVLDSTEKRHEAKLSVRGCELDRDPRPPWGRQVIPPGANTCAVHVTWTNVDYPAAVDPTWSTTGSMATPREYHTSTTLPNGEVLIAGGYWNGAPSNGLASAELYDPVSGTWSSTGMMATARELHTATLLSNGKVLVVAGGGGDNLGPLASVELYDAGAGTWSSASSLSAARYWHTATLLPSGQVLAAGGCQGDGSSLGNADLYDPVNDVWTAGPSMSPRCRHTASSLVDGKVIVTGGGAGGAGTFDGVEIYDPGTNAWTVAANLSSPRQEHAASLLANGQLLVAGGFDGTAATASAELYDPVANAWSPAGVMASARQEYAGAAAGGFLVTGGTNGSLYLSSAELYDTASNNWIAVGSMAASRRDHTASVLAGGAILVAGGSDQSGQLSSAELFVSAPQANGIECAVGAQCVSTLCVDGVCCASACGGQCEACNGATPGVCTPIAGPPRDGRPACDGTGTCEGSCDGANADACSYRGADVQCATACASGIESVSACDGLGVCAVQTAEQCSPYVCDGTLACKHSCGSDTDCVAGFHCGDDATCISSASSSSSGGASSGTDGGGLGVTSGSGAATSANSSGGASFGTGGGNSTIGDGTVAGGGCNCRVVPERVASPGWLTSSWLMGLAALVMRRTRQSETRRRRRRRRPTHFERLC